ncbi:unnamed protein product [Citrullus colocynthis]|uniref:Agglutinin domain-containing protein n=1 Tax=Citrullus colocynthis TaxID=252529 RepID=A0ABP0Y0T8_9ROSI
MSSPVGKTVCFLSLYNGKYLRYPDEDIEGHGFPVFDHGDFERFSLLSPYTKFKIVASSTTATSSYVHIQSAYNNKYWVRSTNDNSWIWAGADEINEDQTAWNCTLFEILNTNEKPNYVRIRHLQLGCYLSLWTASVFYKYGLFADSPNIRDDKRDQVEWTDTGSYFVLPKFIAFKNSASGAYLSGKVIDGQNHLQFLSSNIQDETVMHESFPKAWGGYNIQSTYFAQYWETLAAGFYSAWIVADTKYPDRSDQTLFYVLDGGGNNLVVFKTKAEEFYCKQYSSGNKTNCLYALNTATFDEAKFEVVETISERSIYGVEYRESDARYYDKNKVLLGTNSESNANAVPIEIEFSFPYPISTKQSWNSTSSRKVFQKVSLDAQPPESISINNAKPNGIVQDYYWGEGITISGDDAKLSVKVPPNSIVNIRFYANHYSADIPFRYTQDDTRLDGTKVTTKLDDGLFTIINHVDFNYEIE